MKKKTTLLLLSILFASIGLYAQKLVACENYDSAGKASGIYSAWDIKPAGSYIYLHYSQPQVLGPGAWILQIDRDSTGTGRFTVYKK
ncbi:MAG: hypothetical protein IPM85_03030 [Chitinophagaceae bacterium]|nr:hypothetical protein [Chitinophagaceae bacterium]